MNRYWQIYASYYHRSVGEFAFGLALFSTCAVMSTTGLPFTLDETGETAAAARAAQLPFLRMLLIQFGAGVAAARLQALDYYSLAFLAPGYRRAQLIVAVVGLLLPSWLLVFAMGGAGEARHWIPVGIAVTGVSLAAPRHLSPWWSNGAVVILFGLAFACLFLQLTPRWQSSAALSLLLLVLGIALTLLAFRDALAAHDYRDASDEPRIGFRPNPRFTWLDRSQAMALRSAEPTPTPRGLGARVLAPLLERARCPGRALSSLLVLEAAASQQIGTLLSLCAIPVLAGGLALTAFALDYGAAAVLLAVAAGWMTIISAPFVVLVPTSSLGSLWLAGVGRTKAETMQAMVRLRCVFAATMLLVGLAPTAITLIVLFLQAPEIFASEWSPLVSFGMGILGGTAFFVSAALGAAALGRMPAALVGLVTTVAALMAANFAPRVLGLELYADRLEMTGLLLATGLPTAWLATRRWLRTHLAQRHFAL